MTNFENRALAVVEFEACSVISNAPRASARGWVFECAVGTAAAGRERLFVRPFFIRRAGAPTDEARNPVSPTPSVVDPSRRCRSTIAMRSSLLDSRRPN
jgi:hypothetical protein